MLLKVCVNGARTPGEHPRLSASPEDVAAECADAVAAGANAIHLHPKDEQGRDSLLAPHVDRWVRAVRERCPGTPVGVTTGAWTAPRAADRLHAVRRWRELPDFASVNWHEDGAEDVAAALLERGVGVEAGIWHERGLRAWAASPIRRRCLRVLVEVQDMPPADAETVAPVLVEGVRRADPGARVLLHGEERSTWATIVLARRLGLASRIGLEDTLALPDGRTAAGNAELVRVAHGILCPA